jgi:hypothetical protein
MMGFPGSRHPLRQMVESGFERGLGVWRIGRKPFAQVSLELGDCTTPTCGPRPRDLLLYASADHHAIASRERRGRRLPTSTCVKGTATRRNVVRPAWMIT